MPRSLTTALLKLSMLAFFFAGYGHQLHAQYSEHHHEPCAAHHCEGHEDETPEAPDEGPSSEDSQGCPCAHSCAPSPCIVDATFLWQTCNRIGTLPPIPRSKERLLVFRPPHQPPQFAS